MSAFITEVFPIIVDEAYYGLTTFRKTLFYSCSPPDFRPKPLNKLGFFDAAVQVATVIAAAAINTACPSTLAAKNA
jgi:hypothetical protein